MGLQQYDERVILASRGHLDTSAVVGTYTAIVASNAYDARVDSWQLINNDTVDHHLAIAAGIGNEANVVIEIKVPAGSGFGGVPAVDVLAALQPADFHYVMLLSGDIWYWTVREAIGAGKYVGSFAQGGAF